MKYHPLLTIGLCLLAGVTAGREIRPLESLEFGPAICGGPGSKQVRWEIPPRADGSRRLPVLSWGKPVPSVVKLETATGKPSFDYFHRMTFQLKLEFPDATEMNQIGLRFQDRTGETFHFSCPLSGRKLHGPETLDFTVDGDARQMASWDGNRNGTIDWPLRFQGLMFEFAPNTPADGRIRLDALEYPFDGDPVRISLDTGNRLNLLLPDNPSPPNLVLRGTGKDPLELSGALTVADADGNRQSRPLALRLAPGAEQRIPVPGDYRKQGWWKVHYQLKTASGREFSGDHRFARMTPAGPTPEQADEFLFGLCGHPERFSREEADREAAAAGLCGAKIMRLEFTWRWLEPRPGVWNFTDYDHLVEEFRRNGIELECLLSIDAPWAVAKDYRPRKPSLKHLWCRRPEAKAYAEFARKVADHYKGRIRYFEIWNEPDLVVFANFPSEEYMKLLEAAHDAIKSANPDAKVMNGGIAIVRSNHTDHPDFNRGVLDRLLADGGKHFEIFAFHGHGPLSAYIRQLDELNARGLTTPEKPWKWYANETAITSVGGREKMQAEVLFKKMLTSWARGAIGYNWYLLREKSYYPPGHRERHFGLITAEFEPKPGYVAYNMLANTYRGGRFLGTVPIGSELHALHFKGATGKDTMALWSDRGDQLLLAAGIPAGTVRVDLYGNETPLQTHNGMTPLNLSTEPFSLKMPEAPKEDFHLYELFPQGMPIPAYFQGGAESECSIPVTNPTAAPLTLALGIEAPESIAVSPSSRKMTLRPRETRAASFRIRDTRKETEKTAPPERLRFRVTVDGLNAEFTRELRLRAKDGAYLFQLADPEQYLSLVPNAPGNESFCWHGPDDLRGRVRFSGGKDGLHLDVEVTDDKHVQPFRGADVWKGDNIQFALQLPGQNGFWKFGLTRLADGRSEAFGWNRPAGFPAAAAAIRLDTRRDEKNHTTVYKAVIPCQPIGLTPDMRKKGFRFNLIVNDNDGDRREGFLAVAPGLGFLDDDVESWPILKLD